MAVSREELEKIIKKVINQKGYPFSETEFNCAYYNAFDYLKRNGATPKQIEYFKKKIEKAPIKNGRWNNWSGD